MQLAAELEGLEQGSLHARGPFLYEVPRSLRRGLGRSSSRAARHHRLVHGFEPERQQAQHMGVTDLLQAKHRLLQFRRGQGADSSGDDAAAGLPNERLAGFNPATRE